MLIRCRILGGTRNQYRHPRQSKEIGRIGRYWRAGVALALGIFVLLTAFGGSPTQTTYRATASTVDAEGSASTATTNLTTMTRPGGDPIGSTLDLQGGGVYGVGMPIPVTFSAPIPNGSKADVERRLSVKSDPPQTGAWRWYGDKQVIYRPMDHWRPGTKLTVSTALGGLPVAGSRIDTDRNLTATIGQRTGFQIASATKQMQVFQNDKLVKTIPGKPWQADNADVFGQYGDHEQGTPRALGVRPERPTRRQARRAAHRGRRVHPRGPVVGGRPGSERTSATGARIYPPTTPNGCTTTRRSATR